MRRRDAAAALVLGLLAAALLAQNADAQQSLSANSLVPHCQEWRAVVEGRGTYPPTLSSALHQGVCVGTVVGLSFTAELLPPGIRSCPPKGVTDGQMVRVALAYIERRPQRMHEDFRQLAIEALHEAWPCK
jgi:hypothetical protein